MNQLKASLSKLQTVPLDTDKCLQTKPGTRESYQLAFGRIDNDGSKTIDITELLGSYGHHGLSKPELKNLLLLCGYDEEAIQNMFGRAGLLSASASALSSSVSETLSSTSHGWGGESGMDVVMKLPSETRRAQTIHRKQRELFLERMRQAEEDERGRSGGENEADTFLDAHRRPVDDAAGEERLSQWRRRSLEGDTANLGEQAGREERLSQWRRRSLERDVRGEEKSRNADRLSTKSDSSQPPLIESDGRSLRNSVQEGGETVWGRSLAWLDRELQVPLGCPVAAWQTPYMRKYCNASCHYVSVLTGMLGISMQSERRASSSVSASIGLRSLAPHPSRKGRGRERGQEDGKFASENVHMSSNGKDGRGSKGYGRVGEEQKSYRVFAGPSEASLSLQGGAIDDWEYSFPDRNS